MPGKNWTGDKKLLLVDGRDRNIARPSIWGGGCIKFYKIAKIFEKFEKNIKKKLPKKTSKMRANKKGPTFYKMTKNFENCQQRQKLFLTLVAHFRNFFLTHFWPFYKIWSLLICSHFWQFWSFLIFVFTFFLLFFGTLTPGRLIDLLKEQLDATKSQNMSLKKTVVSTKGDMEQLLGENVRLKETEERCETMIKVIFFVWT